MESNFCAHKNTKMLQKAIVFLLLNYCFLDNPQTPSNKKMVEHNKKFIDVIKNFSDIVKESIRSIERNPHAYTNFVYKIITFDKVAYYYKEFKKYCEREDKINGIANKDNHVFSNEKYRIEIEIKGEEVDFDKDMESLAKTLRKFHSIKIDDICDFDKIADDMLEEALKTIKCSYSKKNHGIQTICDIAKKLNNLKSANKSKKVLTHNDVHPANALKTEKGVVLIDFDYSSMGNPYYDIANIFCEKMFDYEKNQLVDEKCWSREKKLQFIDYYTAFEENSEDVLKQVEMLEPCSHFFWYLWSITSARNATNDGFSYEKYGISRLSFLLKLKIISPEENKLLENLLKNIKNADK